jgi:hypothetical protein
MVNGSNAHGLPSPKAHLRLHGYSILKNALAARGSFFTFVRGQEDEEGGAAAEDILAAIGLLCR